MLVELQLFQKPRDSKPEVEEDQQRVQLLSSSYVSLSQHPVLAIPEKFVEGLATHKEQPGIKQPLYGLRGDGAAVVRGARDHREQMPGIKEWGLTLLILKLCHLGGNQDGCLFLVALEIG